jgi:hypothetical protein
MNLRLLLKLAILPVKRSIFLQGLMVLSFAQILLALWFCGSVQKEIAHTARYAHEARYLSVQLKEETTSIEPIRDLFKDSDVSFEELTTETVLKKMETEEPEIVATVRSIGNEGLQLMPRLLIIRGVFPDDVLEKLKLMTEIYKVDVSPIHHARLLSFYEHLAVEIRFAVAVILFLILVQLMVFHRIQIRDLNEIYRNLSMWGAGAFKARFPGFGSLVVLTGGAYFVSLIEWACFKRGIWKNNAFLGELSFDQDLPLPFLLCVSVFVGIIFLSLVLSFSGRLSEEGER